MPEVITALVPEKFLRQNSDEAGQDVPEQQLAVGRNSHSRADRRHGRSHAKCCHPLLAIGSSVF